MPDHLDRMIADYEPALTGRLHHFALDLRLFTKRHQRLRNLSDAELCNMLVLQVWSHLSIFSSPSDLVLEAIRRLSPKEAE